MKTIILLATLFISTLIASARIGETEEQCKARYGPHWPGLLDKAKKSGEDLKDFKAYGKNGFILVIHFTGDKADTLSVFKGRTIESKHEILTETEIKTFLNANGDGKKWVEIDANSWRTEDRLITACYMQETRVMAFCTREAINRVAAKKESEEREMLDGF
ncbi:MAG: hypothetical protein WCK77_15955 [Verrucomicrobiota bacterium]